jgi:uncharacterized SAM-binding protein YcdF (DUF218 family)
MFFFLSKILAYFTQPFTVISLLFLTAVFVRNQKWKKRIFWTALISLLFFSNEFIANEVMSAWEIKATPYSEVKEYECGIVLTGTTISGLTPNDRVYFARGADRVTHTVELYKLGRIKRILISGGIGTIIEHDEPEADKYRRVMIMMGVPDSVIVVENKTRNTAESAVAVKSILDSLNINPTQCLLITSAFHMRRSLACYTKQELDVQVFTADFYSHPREYHIDAFLIPQFDAMLKWQKLCKEWVGFVAYKFTGYI